MVGLEDTTKDVPLEDTFFQPVLPTAVSRSTAWSANGHHGMSVRCRATAEYDSVHAPSKCFHEMTDANAR
jgi:hypothetical protein